MIDETTPQLRLVSDTPMTNHNLITCFALDDGQLYIGDGPDFENWHAAGLRAGKNKPRLSYSLPGTPAAAGVELHAAQKERHFLRLYGTLPHSVMEDIVTGKIEPTRKGALRPNEIKEIVESIGRDTKDYLFFHKAA
ncbi:hypothetical protein CMI47_04360 [Candidatus Pacearchaeota archaeon]|nr:hypothetical protein [Candidatus Pacearchaeota archaeon]|tara:strand:+ start:20 stop:430 length:411 start_codon:yes stop_codon:yes gene_type:complete